MTSDGFSTSAFAPWAFSSSASRKPCNIPTPNIPAKIVVYLSYEHACNKKSQILNTTESGFGGGWWKANRITGHAIIYALSIPLYFLNRKTSYRFFNHFLSISTLLLLQIKYYVMKNIVFLWVFPKNTRIWPRKRRCFKLDKLLFLAFFNRSDVILLNFCLEKTGFCALRVPV